MFRKYLITSVFALVMVFLSSCSTGLDTQMEAVLDQVEEDLGYVNTVSVEDMAKMTNWFERRGDDSQKARAWFCLGRSQFNDRAYSAAIVSYTRALEYAGKAGDPYREGLICRDMARISGASGNAPDELLYLARASEAFKAAGLQGEFQRTLLEIGQAQAASGKHEAAEEIFKSVLYDSHEMGDTLLEARCLESYASLAVSKDIPDPALAIDMLDRAANDLGYPLNSSDKGIVAYSYSLAGKPREAWAWLSDAKASAETDEDVADADFREYQIASRSGDSARALKALERVTEYGDKAQSAALEEAVSASQRDYLQGESDIQAEKLRSARLKMWLLALAALLVVGALAVVYLYYRSEQRRLLEAEIAERDRYMTIAEDLRSALRQAQVLRLAQGPEKGPGFEALERLCEQYYIYEGTENLQPRILKEVKSIVEGLRSDKKVRKNLEDTLDARHDGVMTKLRAEFPNWKEEDFQLYSFTAAGFSSTTISALMEKEKSVIYNRVWRLKGRISNSESPLKEYFLTCLDS
ncbi:MAG: hypothetical protein IJK05_05785 [Bacteroidales bacterium]|nr:hypothetical protein [Bacteroidales bacterium]